MRTIQQSLQDVKNCISAISQDCKRTPGCVALLAVSKTKSVSAISEAISAGQRAFGENYVQEGMRKIQHFSNLPEGAMLEWHFIGLLQSNKSRFVAENFNWCQTVDQLRIAERLNNQRPTAMAPLNILIQVNISNEKSKSGIALNALPALAKAISGLPNIILRGIMAIPAQEIYYQQQLAVFRQVNHAFLTIQECYPQVDTLSIGMTNDMAAAIAAGSTMVRIGTAIFD